MGGSCNSAGTVALQCGTVLSYLLLTVGDKGIKCPSRSPGQHRGGPLGAPPFATMAAACHRMPQAARCLATCPRGKPRSDAWRASWSAVLRWRSCRGKWLAAGVVFLCLIACQLSGLAGALGAPRRASLVVPGFGLPDKLLLSGARSSVSLYFVLGWPYMGSVVPASSSCRGLVFSARQAPLAGGLVFLARQAPLAGGSLLECLVFSGRFLGRPCRRVLQLPVHKSGVLRYPYFSTPTGAP